ncbi:MAG: hypothetical protein O2805_02635 [Proteobacteria bacterium]|nr:hypothetical protein [Pseudomonadota bacterium]
MVRNARPFETERLPQSASTDWSGFELLEVLQERGSTTYRPLDLGFRLNSPDFFKYCRNWPKKKADETKVFVE